MTQVTRTVKQGTCPSCGKVVTLNKDGGLRRHGPRTGAPWRADWPVSGRFKSSMNCPGSYEQPTETTEVTYKTYEFYKRE